MIMLLIDAALLMSLLKVMNDDEMSLLSGGLLSVGTSIGTAILVFVFSKMLGFLGVCLALVLAAMILGAALSALYGVVLTRAFLIAGLFMVFHMAISISLSFMFAT